QHEFTNDYAIPSAIATALAADAALRADYQKAITFYSRLTNPMVCLNAADLIGMDSPDQTKIETLSRDRGVTKPAVALFPNNRSREVVLFEKLFPTALPENADLMREFIKRIQSGAVDLRPNAASGWYEYQVYALETLLLPEKGEENKKLL